MEHIELTVPLGDRSYPIQIGTNLLAGCGKQIALLTSSRVLLVSNPTVFEIYGEPVEESLAEAGLEVYHALIPDGEEFKNMEETLRVIDQALHLQLDRKSVVVALGGGVVGDLAGFAAAIYQRGIPFIQIPTTLLAQVDSSVGGKVGVNHPLGKNMIGAFHQPLLVVADLNTLDTLEARDYKSGLGEVVKYGVAWDKTLFEFLVRYSSQINQRDKSCLQHIVYESCRIKSDIVGQDERESGLRAVLNLGHTFGHSLEKLGGYADYRHGEAVAMGIVAASYLAEELGLIQPQETQRIIDLLKRLELPVRVPGYDAEDVYNGMLGDKKASRNGLRFVLPTGIGSYIMVDNPDKDLVLKAIRCAQAKIT
ncbi:MAG: 3-dehydroquinate synthase [Syntrophomonadaceae bacterium]|jgi:3-dehydroquinate synthase